MINRYEKGSSSCRSVLSFLLLFKIFRQFIKFTEQECFKNLQNRNPCEKDLYTEALMTILYSEVYMNYQNVFLLDDESLFACEWKCSAAIKGAKLTKSH